MVVPLYVAEVVHVLKIHDDSFDPVSDLHGDRGKLYAAHLLEIGELGDLHAVEPDLPPEAPCAESRGFPIVLHKPDVVNGRSMPKVRRLSRYLSWMSRGEGFMMTWN